MTGEDLSQVLPNDIVRRIVDDIMNTPRKDNEQSGVVYVNLVPRTWVEQLEDMNTGRPWGDPKVLHNTP